MKFWFSNTVKANLEQSEIHPNKFLLLQFGVKGFPQHHTTVKTQNFLPVGMCGGDSRVADTNANHAENLKKWNVCAPTFQRASSFQAHSAKQNLSCWVCAVNAGKQSHNLDWLRGKRRDSLIRRLGCRWTQSFWIFTNLIMKSKDASSESICVCARLVRAEWALHEREINRLLGGLYHRANLFCECSWNIFSRFSLWRWVKWKCAGIARNPLTCLKTAAVGERCICSGTGKTNGI